MKTEHKRSHPSANLPKIPQVIEVHDLPKHLVVFALWLYARPDVAVVRHGPTIRTAGDVKQFLETDRKESFQWLDRRAMFFSLNRDENFNARDYDRANGKLVAFKAIAGLRTLLEEKSQDLGSREKAIEAITNADWRTLAPHAERFFPPGLAIFDEITREIAP